MPSLAWDLLPMSKYRAHNWHCLDGLERQPYAALYTTLGCPYHCSFCCIQAPFKSGERAAGYRDNVNSYRAWNPDTVLDQIDLLVNRHGVRNLKIADEMFVLNRRHVLGVCDRLIERRYDLTIWAYTRVDTIKDHLRDMLKAAGLPAGRRVPRLPRGGVLELLHAAGLSRHGRAPLRPGRRPPQRAHDGLPPRARPAHRQARRAADAAAQGAAARDRVDPAGSF